MFMLIWGSVRLTERTLSVPPAEVAERFACQPHNCLAVGEKISCILKSAAVASLDYTIHERAASGNANHHADRKNGWVPAWYKGGPVLSHV